MFSNLIIILLLLSVLINEQTIAANDKPVEKLKIDNPQKQSPIVQNTVKKYTSSLANSLHKNDEKSTPNKFEIEKFEEDKRVRLENQRVIEANLNSRKNKNKK